MFFKKISIVLFSAIMFFVTSVYAYPIAIKTDIDVVTLKKRPLRIVTLEHRYTEMVLSLGITPVGVADIASYTKYDGVFADKLKNVTDVGLRANPSFLAINQLNPDLIIGTRLRNQAAYKQLTKLAPTLLFDGIEITQQSHGQFSNLKNEFFSIAKSLAKEKAADIVWQKLLATVTWAKANKPGEAVYLSVAQFLPGAPQIRLFTKDAVVQEVLAQAGFLPGWSQLGGVGSYGYQVVGITALKQIHDSYFVYINERADDYNLRRIVNNPAWQAFAFVKSGRDYRLQEDIWPWGGPLAVAKFIQAVMAVINQKANLQGPILENIQYS